MTVYVVEIVTEDVFGPVAHIASTMEKAIEWIKEEGAEFAGIELEDTDASKDVFFNISSEKVDGNMQQFYNFGAYNIHGVEI